jgi:Flp pilus assembly protein TadB
MEQPQEWGAGLPRPGEGKPISHAFRVVWLIWCVLWAIFWITVGWLLLPLVNVVLCALSLVCGVGVYAVPNDVWRRR